MDGEVFPTRPQVDNDVANSLSPGIDKQRLVGDRIPQSPDIASIPLLWQLGDRTGPDESPTDGTPTLCVCIGNRRRVVSLRLLLLGGLFLPSGCPSDT